MGGSLRIEYNLYLLNNEKHPFLIKRERITDAPWVFLANEDDTICYL
jgi:hypothetical protein